MATDQGESFATMNQRRVEVMEADVERIYTAIAEGRTWRLLCLGCYEVFKTTQAPEDRTYSDDYCVNCLFFAKSANLQPR